MDSRRIWIGIENVNVLIKVNLWIGITKNVAAVDAVKTEVFLKLIVLLTMAGISNYTGAIDNFVSLNPKT
jgi:hypothetical protein